MWEWNLTAPPSVGRNFVPEALSIGSPEWHRYRPQVVHDRVLIPPGSQIVRAVAYSYRCSPDGSRQDSVAAPGVR